MFFINDRVGVAYESCEGGLARYNPKDDDFNILMANEEIDAVLGDVPVRRVTEEEALDLCAQNSLRRELLRLVSKSHS